MRRHLPGIIAAFAFVQVLVGVVVFEVGERSGSPANFGWTAYAPLPAESYWTTYSAPPAEAYGSQLTLGFYDGGAVLSSGGQVLGAVLVVVGLLVLTAVGSWLAGRRSAAPG